jgi:hypothetical protein
MSFSAITGLLGRMFFELRENENQFFRTFQDWHRAGEFSYGRADAAEAGDRCFEIARGLFGSLALTGKGHGIDRAIVLGLMGERPDGVDPVSIRPSTERERPSGWITIRYRTFAVPRGLFGPFSTYRGIYSVLLAMHISVACAAQRDQIFF